MSNFGYMHANKIDIEMGSSYSYFYSFEMGMVGLECMCINVSKKAQILFKWSME